MVPGNREPVKFFCLFREKLKMTSRPCNAPTAAGPPLSWRVFLRDGYVSRVQVVCSHNGCTHVNAPAGNWCATCQHPTKPNVPDILTAQNLAARNTQWDNAFTGQGLRNWGTLTIRQPYMCLGAVLSITGASKNGRRVFCKMCF